MDHPKLVGPLEEKYPLSADGSEDSQFLFMGSAP